MPHNWTEEEDALLLVLVEKHGKDQWQTISRQLDFPDN